MDAKDKRVVDEYTRKLIRIKASQLSGKYGYTKSDREDVEQELALHLIRRSEQYDPLRAGKNTFVNRIVDRKVSSILRERFAAKRDYRRTISFDSASACQGAPQAECAEQRQEYNDPCPDLAIDLEAAVECLEDDMLRMCRLLKHESIAEAAQRLGLTRAQARTRVSKIRKLLTENGLNEYVNA